MSDREIKVLSLEELPIELKNHKGENIASIYYSDHFKGYIGSVNGHNIEDSYLGYPRGYNSLSDCVKATFAFLYTRMQDYRKEAEEYQELKEALRTALSTPFNKL
jgi:hypothetical protein